MNKYIKFIVIYCTSTCLIPSYCWESKNAQQVQKDLHDVKDIANTANSVLTNVVHSVLDFAKDSKKNVDSTMKEMDNHNSSCKEDLNELNNKFNLIYEYINSKLNNILQNRNYTTIDNIRNEIAQLQSTLNFMIKAETAKEVNQILQYNNQFNNSTYKYGNNQNNNTSFNNNIHYYPNLNYNNLNNLYNKNYSTQPPIVFKQLPNAIGTWRRGVY